MNSFSFEYFEIIQVIRYLERVRIQVIRYLYKLHKMSIDFCIYLEYLYDCIYAQYLHLQFCTYSKMFLYPRTELHKTKTWIPMILGADSVLRREVNHS
jgi:hypothetical protein